ncbi:hypothetical protein DM01DRAFT_1334985 [Hesseltinella vesiculosa]|uniref:Anaphase-promoting complex subunit 5 n=1 Tax=Hesseltinella vesiculosa TaxID=101127 RepID=A0A1X2GL39_9FUNG|nr:hypothetical protein DM01DRAFT_1334985 [Hesseltinella vesiculosa]
MDDFFSGPARTPLIIRTPFITPFKLVLLFLIYEFCHFQMFSTTTIPHAVKYLVECVLRSKESYIEPEFKDILAKFEEFDQPPQNMALVDSIRSKLARMKYPDNLFQFMTSLSNILDLNEEDGGGNGDYTVLEANSLFGLFARRCRVEFLRYSTQRKAELFEIFRGYITGKAKNKQLVPKQEDAMDEDIKTVYLSVDPIGLDETYRLDGWISDDQVDKFLTQQAENMERTGTTNVSPTTLDRYLDFLQKHAPDLGKIYQVRFLNHIRTYEYEGAVENLHQFYDYCFHHRETPMYQYALLSLGILEAKFKHTQRALMAFDEASIVAREHQDRECLNEVQSWISFLKGKVYDDVTTESDKNEDDGLKNTTYLKTMHQIQRIQDMLKSGKHPIKVFEKLYQCGILAYLKNIDYVAVPHFSTMANAWQQYGSHLLADTYNKMALENEPATMDDLEHAYLQTIDSVRNVDGIYLVLTSAIKCSVSMLV